MGQIRSALDIALEKTADIHGEKGHADNREIKNTGKKTASNYLASGDTTILEKFFSAQKSESLSLCKEGVISILLASLRLPVIDEDLDKIRLSGNGIEITLPNSGMSQLFNQVEQIMKQYLTERTQLEKTMEQQFMPRLRAKQQEMAKRYGQTLPLELSTDSEYLSALAKNRRMLEQKYDTVIEEVRSRVKEIAGIEE